MQSAAVLPVADRASAMILFPLILSSAETLPRAVCGASNIVLTALTFNHWHDNALLNSRWALKPVHVDTAEELALKVYFFEGVNHLIKVGLDLTCGQ